MNTTFSESFITETVSVLQEIDADQIEAVARGLASVRNGGGRLFILGVGGSAGHASHAVNDFRKICNFEAYTPTDNVSELTARINDEGWDSSFRNWLVGSRIRSTDAILIFSVGGGDPAKGVSTNLVQAIDLAKALGTSVFGIVGRDGGYTVQAADACVVIPPVFLERITPHTEGLCAVVWHLLVSHPILQRNGTHWEQVAARVKVCIVGGAGFIGSHFTDRLLSDAATQRVTLFDNFSSGREWHFQHHLGDTRLHVVRADVGDLAALTAAMAGHELVIHLASNPDIARAMTSPRVDFDEGTALTFHVVEAARLAGVSEILYASGSGVYGDLGELEVAEDHGPLVPTSTYGASKLAGEAMLSSYAAMFGLTATVFRFGNVVGPRQTHGVGFDFIRRLRRKPEALDILGDGRQSKSYVHVDDVVSAVLMMRATRERKYEAFNVATGDYITVTEIALLALQVLGLTEDTTELRYAGGDRGWKGDVPIVRLSTERIRARGWSCGHTSKEALLCSMRAMVPDDELGRLTT